MKIGDKVTFKAAVVRRSGYHKRDSDMRGIIIEFMSGGKVVRVDTKGTWVSEDGRSIRCIPVANLCRVREDGLILDPTN